MKRVLFLLCFILMLACSDDIDYGVFVDDEYVPEWALERVKELYSTDIKMVRIYKYVLEKNIYYHIYSTYSSCWGCEIYDRSGNLVTDRAVYSILEEYESRTLIWYGSEEFLWDFEM